MQRRIRCQGAIVREDHILLIKHRHHDDGRDYWLIPGGGLEDGETEEQCVQREMREETNLEVSVERLVLEETSYLDDRIYAAYKTFLCRSLGGEARPGYEPEADAASVYSISEVGWFDLRDEAAWDDKIKSDPFTYPLLKKLQAALGY